MRTLLKKILPPSIKKLLPSDMKYAIYRLFLTGNAVECVICNKTFSKFLPFGTPPRKQALCPNCRSLERTRLFWKYLTDQSDFFEKHLRVFHVAPEDVLYQKFKAVFEF